ncbi:MAG TPA: TonB-dependent receptor, partial [Nevskiaceae bacterium]|nr:TonB-dependent receptor [Nevskiaceae bacterium]
VVNYDNAPKAPIYGAEADTVWTPFPELNPGMALTFAICFLDTKYTDYPNGRGFDEDTGLTFGPGGVLPLLPARDFTGNEIPRTPDLTYTVGVGQSVQTGNGTLEFGMDLSYNDGFWFSAQNIDIEAVDSYYLLNAHLSYDYEPWDVRLSLWGKNLADTEYSQIIFIDDLGRNHVLNDPRTYGMRLTWQF